MGRHGDAPSTNSARKPPQNSFLFNARAADEAVELNKPKKAVDPRFNPHVYHGNAVKQNVEMQYSFLQDIAQEDFKKRTSRLSVLKKERRIRARENQQRAAIGGKKGKKSSKVHDDYAEDDNEDDEGNNNDEEEEEDEEDLYHADLDEEERIRIGLMRDSEIEKEMNSLKKQINQFKMQQGEKRADRKKSDIRKKWAKSQVSAVKAGKQKNAFFLNDKQMKMNQMKEELQKAKKNGTQATNSFVEKRLKKRFDAKHLRR